MAAQIALGKVVDVVVGLARWRRALVVAAPVFCVFVCVSERRRRRVTTGGGVQYEVVGWLEEIPYWVPAHKHVGAAAEGRRARHHSRAPNVSACPFSPGRAHALGQAATDERRRSRRDAGMLRDERARRRAPGGGGRAERAPREHRKLFLFAVFRALAPDQQAGLAWSKHKRPGTCRTGSIEGCARARVAKARCSARRCAKKGRAAEREEAGKGLRRMRRMISGEGIC